jgi:hypothetical protein
MEVIMDLKNMVPALDVKWILEELERQEAELLIARDKVNGGESFTKMERDNFDIVVCEPQDLMTAIKKFSLDEEDK